MLSKGNLLDGLNEAQQENIKAMVAGLEERLKDNPDDLEGWLRLIRSYDVLEQEHKAIMALIQLSELQAQSLEIQLAVLERILVKNRSQANSEFLEYADIALKRAFKLSRSHPETLFFAGHFAKITGRLDEARRYWSELLEAVPADNEIAKLLKKEIDTLSP